jgi:hypothetical protein
MGVGAGFGWDGGSAEGVWTGVDGGVLDGGGFGAGVDGVVSTGAGLEESSGTVAAAGVGCWAGGWDGMGAVGWLD